MHKLQNQVQAIHLTGRFRYDMRPRNIYSLVQTEEEDESQVFDTCNACED